MSKKQPLVSGVAWMRVVRDCSVWACVLLGLVVVAGGGLARAAGDVVLPPVPAVGLAPLRSVEGISEYRLRNGLQILLVPDASKPTTTVNMVYRVGSRHESYGETGMAHLLEHLLFKGSPRHPQPWAEFNQRGLHANGSTWYDRTNYFASFAANDDTLKWYLAWQADAMLNSHIAQPDLDSEMTVVRNELEMGDNDPQSVLFEQTVAAMYHWHNYGKATIGTRSDVEGVDIARLRAFYRTYYQPDNATLIVSGRFDPLKVQTWVREFFAPLPKPSRVLPRQYTQEPVQEGERSITVRRAGGVPLLFAGYHVPTAADPDHAAVKALGVILADVPSGRLHKRLTEQRLAASVFSFAEGLLDPGFAMFGAELGPQQRAGDVGDATREALLDTIESLAREPITEPELRRAKAKWLKHWDVVFADPQRVGVALSEAVAQGDWRLFFLTRDRVRDLRIDDVQRVAQRYLQASNRTLGEYRPTAEPGRAPLPSRPDIAAMLNTYRGQDSPAAVEPFDAAPASIEARTRTLALPNGMKAALLPKPTRGEAVRATLTLRFGDERSLRDWGDAPAMLAALIDKGSAQLDREAVQDRLDELRSEVAFVHQPGALTINITSRRASLAPVLTLLGELLREPALSEAALEEVRQQALSTLEQQRKDPEAVADNAVARHGNPYSRGDVRYARSFDEMATDLKLVTSERVRAFHARFYGANYAQFGAVGDFDEAQIRQTLEAAFGHWSSASAYTRVPDPLVPREPAQAVFRTPGKPNAVLMIELPLPLSDRDDDHVALMMANQMLGADGNSRLWNRIREKEGLSYAVGSSIQWNPFDAHSTWVASAIFAPQNRARIEQTVREEIEHALAQGFSAQELSAGKRSLLSFRQLARAQDSRLAAGWAQNLYLSRNYTESARIDAAIEKLTLEQVNAALRRYIRPDRFVWVVAGDIAEEAVPKAPQP